MTKTIMGIAKSGNTTEEMKRLSEIEDVPVEKIRERIASGRIVITRNIRRESIRTTGIGEGLYTKVNVNIGTSSMLVDIEMEKKKAHIAVKYGADTIMDLSTGGNLDEIRRILLKEVEPLPLGTVPAYQAWIEGVKKYGGVSFPSEWFIEIVERQLRDGVDFMTIHSALSLELARKAVASTRIMPIVSRGGAMLAVWMLENNEENPFRQHWDYLLELFREYDAVISIGDSLRPGTIMDQHDELQVTELIEIARQVKQAREHDVQVIVEGPGHMTLDQITSNITLMKKLTNKAPYYVLGPLVTDIAMGYDHIAAAIGGAIAAAHGADFLCYLTPAEHLSLPTIEQVREGLVATRIAAHAGDIVKLGKRAYRRDVELSVFRARLEWDRVLEYAFDIEKAREIYTQFPVSTRGCNMCGQYCVFLLLDKLLKKPALKQ